MGREMWDERITQRRGESGGPIARPIADMCIVDSPSRIRDTAASTFDALNDKYATSKTNGNGKGKRVKIFDDDLSDEEEEVVRYGEDGFGTDGDEEDEEDEENEDLDDEEEEEEEEDYSGEGEEDESEGDGAEEDNGEEDFRSFKPSLSALPKPKNVASDPKAVKVLDPMSALKSAKAKDVEKGEGIRRQQVITTRTTSNVASEAYVIDSR